jgi:hypothetical protein
VRAVVSIVPVAPVVGDVELGEHVSHVGDARCPTTADANPDAGPPMIDGGPPHMTAGMIAELEVTP